MSVELFFFKAIFKKCHLEMRNSFVFALLGSVLDLETSYHGLIQSVMKLKPWMSWSPVSKHSYTRRLAFVCFACSGSHVRHSYFGFSSPTLTKYRWLKGGLHGRKTRGRTRQERSTSPKFGVNCQQYVFLEKYLSFLKFWGQRQLWPQNVKEPGSLPLLWYLTGPYLIFLPCKWSLTDTCFCV